MVLDGLAVTFELCSEILLDDTYNVRILSIRDVTNLNENKLRHALSYACRPGRPEGTPRLKGLYIFGTGDDPATDASGETFQCRGPGRGFSANIGNIVQGFLHRWPTTAMSGTINEERSQSRWRCNVNGPRLSTTAAA